MLDKIGEREQSSSIAVQASKHGITGLAIPLTGIALGFISIELILEGVIDMGSGLVMLLLLQMFFMGLAL
jgi:hypothetical protein